MKVGMVLCLNEKREQAVADMTGRVWWALCVSKGCILNAGSSWHGPSQPCRRVMGLSPAQRQQDAALVLAILNGRNCLASSLWDKVDLILGHPRASGKTGKTSTHAPPAAFSKRCPRLVQRVILALLWPGSLSCLLTRQAERIMMLILTLFLADK